MCKRSMDVGCVCPQLSLDLPAHCTELGRAKTGKQWGHEGFDVLAEGEKQGQPWGLTPGTYYPWAQHPGESQLQVEMGVHLCEMLKGCAWGLSFSLD